MISADRAQGPAMSAACALLTVALLSQAVQAETPDWRDPATLPAMRGMAVDWVSRKMRYNSVPMNMRLFSSDRSLTEVRAHYEDWFRNRGTGDFVVTKGDDELILGASIHGTYHTVKLKTVDGKTVGSLLSSSDPKRVNGRQVDRQPMFAHSNQLELINRVESLDDGTYSDVSTFMFSASTDSASRWLDEELAQNGWRSDGSLGSSSTNQYQKDREQVQVSVVSHPSGRHDRSLVTVIWVIRS
jgi:hypothetical protein